MQDVSTVITVDKDLKKKIVEGADGTKYCIEISFSAYGKKIIVSKFVTVQLSQLAKNLAGKQQMKGLYLHTLLQRRFGSIFNVVLNLRGIGLSFID